MAGKSRLAEFLKSRDCTQGELAEVLGITEAALSLKANGRSPFKQGEIKRVSEHFGLSPQELYELFFG